MSNWSVTSPTTCNTCQGARYVYTAAGQAVKCPACFDYLAHSRLTPAECQASLAHITGRGDMAKLRAIGEAIIADGMGWFTVWGGTGSAKTLFLQALTVGFCRQKRQAIYYHAADLCNGLYRDLDNPDSANMELYRRASVLVIDELDKYHFTDWSRRELQSLLDHRYRHMRDHVTLFACNKDPNEDWLPADIRSRMNDGRFYRTVAGGQTPGVFHVTAPDMRPNLKRSAPAAAKLDATTDDLIERSR